MLKKRSWTFKRFFDLFYSEATARKKGLLQLLDPRVKMVSFLGDYFRQLT